MMHAPAHPSDAELAAFADVPLEDATGHLASCATCRERVARMRDLAGALAAIAAPPDDPGMAPQVLARIRNTPSRFGLGLLIGASAAAVIAVVASSSVPPSPGTFSARGGPAATPVEVTAFVQSGHGRVPLTADTRVAPGFVLSFRAIQRTTGTTGPGEHLMIFGCDANDELHWAVPIWDDAATDPVGLRLDPHVPLLELPTALQPDAPPGPFTFIALTTPTPLGVKAVEQLVTSCATARSALERLPDSHVADVRFQVVAPPL